MGCTDPLGRGVGTSAVGKGVGAPHQCPHESDAIYRCYLMLTFAILMTHRIPKGACAAKKVSKFAWLRKVSASIPKGFSL